VQPALFVMPARLVRICEVEFRIGISGWTAYRGWREMIRPDEDPAPSQLAAYGRAFDAVELNSTFYRLPLAKTVLRWREEVPGDFSFAVKAPREITHRKRLRDAGADLAAFFGLARNFGRKLGPVLFQFPAGFAPQPELLESFLDSIPDDVQATVELRHPGWWTDGTRRLLERHGVAFCIHDIRSRMSPLMLTAPFAYFRFHGPKADPYRGRYGADRLAEIATLLRSLEGQIDAAYVFFDNTADGSAATDARGLRALIAG